MSHATIAPAKSFTTEPEALFPYAFSPAKPKKPSNPQALANSWLYDYGLHWSQQIFLGYNDYEPNRILLEHPDSYIRAVEYKKLGIPVIPIKSKEKTPAVRWSPWMNHEPVISELEWLFSEKKADYSTAIPLGQKVAGGGHLADIDCDSEEVYTRVKAWLDERKIKAWEYSSSPGRGHFLFRSETPFKKIQVGKLEIRSRGCYSVCPGSIHASGNVYIFKAEFLAKLPLISDDAIENLAGEKVNRLAEKVKKVPRKVWRILQGNVKIGENQKYHSNSEAEANAILILTEVGFTVERIISLFKLRAHKNSHFARHQNGERWIYQRYGSALDYLHHKANQSLFDSFDLLEQKITNMAWKYRGGELDLLVLLAHIKIARRKGKDTYNFSLNDCAIETGYTKQAISKAQRRLQEKSYLSVVKKHTRKLATVWKLILPSTQNTSRDEADASVDSQALPHTATGLCESTMESLLGIDAFKFRGGRTCLIVYDWVLRNNGIDRKTLVQSTGRCKKAVDKACAWLLVNGLATEIAGNYTAVQSDKVDWERVARRNGTYGSMEQYRRHIELKRLCRRQVMRLSATRRTATAEESKKD